MGERESERKRKREEEGRAGGGGEIDPHQIQNNMNCSSIRNSNPRRCVGDRPTERVQLWPQTQKWHRHSGCLVTSQG